ncbi:MAG: carbohydrate kinase, partial [Cytophagaceae bacterium]
MTASDITALFQRFSTIQVGVIGDFALDLYFTLQTRTGERSLETQR